MVVDEFEEFEEELEEDLEEEGAEGEEEELEIVEEDRLPEGLLITTTGALIVAILLAYYVLGSNYGIGLFKSAYQGL